MSGLTGALIVGGIAAAGTIGAAAISSDAASKTADKQMSAEEKALQMQIDERKRITDAATASAKMSPGEVKSINSMLATRGQALTQSLQSIQKQQEQLDALDPTVKAAGKNVYDLLTGKSAAILAPMQKKLDQSRAQMMNKLQAQLGPGFMTSSAGMEAMLKFDTESAMTLGTAQQQALTTVGQTYSSLLGTQQAGQNAVTSQTQNAFANAINTDASVLGAYQNETNRVTNATLGAPGAAPVDFRGPASVAGNAFAGTQIWANALGQVSGAAGQVAGQQIGANMWANANGGGAGAGATPLTAQVPSIPNLNPGFGSSATQTFATGSVGG